MEQEIEREMNRFLQSLQKMKDSVSFAASDYDWHIEDEKVSLTLKLGG